MAGRRMAFHEDGHDVVNGGDGGGGGGGYDGDHGGKDVYIYTAKLKFQYQSLVEGSPIPQPRDGSNVFVLGPF